MRAPVSKVVARYTDGRLVKGYTFDFQPSATRFHVFPDPGASQSPATVFTRDLKALFFVRDHLGDAKRCERTHFLRGEHAQARRVEVALADGERVVGVAERPEPDAPGFFLVPVDPASNNLRIYVVAAGIKHVQVLPDASPVRRVLQTRAPARPEMVPLLPRRFLSWLTG